MTTKKHTLAIIIINYNSSGFTLKCINSLLQHTDPTLNHEIIVVDNASEKEDYLFLKTALDKLQHPHLSLYRSRINTGFGGGNMFGVQFAKAQYYLFLNNDTELKEDAISQCLHFMESHPQTAVCGPTIYNEFGEKQLGFDYFTSFGREAFGKKWVEWVHGKPNRRKAYQAPIAVDYVNGSFMLFRAKDFDRVGGFDTNIFLYYEESDICQRLKQLGKDTHFIPTTSYVHYQGQSVKKTKMPLAIKMELKTSMFYVVKKHRGFFEYKALQCFFVLRYGLGSIIKPKNIALLRHILIGLPLSKSLKQKQQVTEV
ncbi:glycosyltransferase family 2 protein [Maribacter sp. 2307ULW6-5]|uniref:glycosyltransferase family 2 protein n=1 Tax=Maribacter sp. 2307ULW6-5 TaxID=3386275 RepID=UPI0039BD7545